LRNQTGIAGISLQATTNAIGPTMAQQQRSRSKAQSGAPHTKGDAPAHRGGDAARKAQRWGGGNKAAKGSVSRADRRNENSSANR
jgi:hypothetical protein